MIREYYLDFLAACAAFGATEEQQKELNERYGFLSKEEYPELILRCTELNLMLSSMDADKKRNDWHYKTGRPRRYEHIPGVDD